MSSLIIYLWVTYVLGLMLVSYIYVQIYKFKRLIEITKYGVQLYIITPVLLIFSPIVIPAFVVIFIYQYYQNNFLVKFKVAYNEETKKELLKTNKPKD